MENKEKEYENYYNYEKIYKDYSAPSFLNQEVYTADDIFRDFGFTTGAISVHDDIHYASPEHKQYIFTNADTECYVMYPNNICTPIRKKSMYRITESKGMNKMLRSQQPTGYIVVVDYYTINTNSQLGVNYVHNLVEYYRNASNIYPNNLEIKDYITNFLRSTKKGTQLLHPVTVRIITKIPLEDVQKYKKLYVPTCGIVLAIGKLHNNFVHPASEQYTEYSKRVWSDVSNHIEIDLVDNGTMNNYYMKVGNEIVKLHPSKNVDRKDGCIVSVYKDQTLVTSKSVELSNINEVGAYHTEEEAEYHGNMQLKNETAKLQVDFDKIKLEKEKLRVEVQKLAVDKLEIEHRKEKLNIELYQLEEKLKHEREKMECEKFLMREKSIQSFIDYIRKVAEMRAAVIKSEHDVKIYSMKEQDIQSKETTSKVKDVIDISGRVVNLVSSLSKLYITAKATA